MRDATTRRNFLSPSFSDSVLAAALKKAVEADELTPVFQPLFDLRSQSISGFEILARWGRGEDLAVGPAEFIPLAEASGILPLLLEKLLRKACGEAMDWPEKLTLAINISPFELENIALPVLIRNALEPMKFPLSRLEIEMTEQAFAGPIEQALAIACELKTLGMRLIMDACGIGHSSLSRLKLFPFDAIKIDSSFIHSLEIDSDSREIVGAIIALGQSLGLTTIAKGVERQSQAEVLMRMGCSAAQGWLYGHPVPACEVPFVLQAERPGEVLNAASVLADSRANHLVKAEERVAHLEMAYNTTPLGLAYLDLEFRYVSVNETFARMFGRKVGAFVGRFLAAVLPEWRLQLIGCLEQTLAGGIASECEICLSGADENDSKITYLHTCQAVRAPYGGLIGFSVALVDITRRKSSEAALLKSETNYRLADRLNPHIPWTSSPDGSKIEVSSRWHAWTRLSSGAISQEEWFRNVHPEDRLSVDRLWRASMQSGEAYEAEYRVSCADGHLCWIRARAAAGRGAEGEIIRWYGIVEDIANQKHAEGLAQEKTGRLEMATRQLEVLIREDHLTGLANRRYFDEVLQREVRFALRSQLPLALVMIDLDYFKSFNDSYGHVAGDTCLRQVSSLLANVLHRPTDLGARYGGEEFALILPDTTEEGAIHIAEKTLAKLRALAIEHIGSPLKRVTLSAGVAVLEQKSALRGASRINHFVQRADVALYSAKKDGRDRVAIATVPMMLAGIIC